MAEEQRPRGRLHFEQSTASWATTEFVNSPTPLAARSFVYVISVVIAASFVYAGLFQIAVTVEAKGAIATETAVLPIRVAINFRVAKLFVKESQPVRQGDILMVSEDELSATEYEMIHRDIRELLSLVAAVEDLKIPCKDCLVRLEALVGRSFVSKDKPSLKDVLSPLQEGLRDFFIRFRDLISLPNLVKGLNNQIALDRRKLDEIERRRATRLLEMDVDRLKQEILSNQAQIEERTQSLRTQLRQSRAHLEVAAAGVQASLAQYHDQQTITSPSDGTVTHLQVSGSGQLLTPGQESMQLVPRDSVFVAGLKIANRDISRIRPGMEVKIKLDALPEQEFGTVSGTVLSVPATTYSNPAPAEESTYEVPVKLSCQYIVKDGVKFPFKHGMTLTGNVITERQPLLTLGLRMLFRIKNETFHDY